MRLSLPTAPQYVKYVDGQKVQHLPVIGFVHHNDEMLPLVDQGHPTMPLLSVVVLDSQGDNPRTLHNGECPSPA